jgi:hypothetical protein
MCCVVKPPHKVVLLQASLLIQRRGRRYPLAGEEAVVANILDLGVIIIIIIIMLLFLFDPSCCDVYSFVPASSLSCAAAATGISSSATFPPSLLLLGRATSDYHSSTWHDISYSVQQDIRQQPSSFQGTITWMAARAATVATDE